jgi:hypothetical protein
MQQILLRRPKSDNQNNKRWSTSITDPEEQISLQSPYLTLLTNKLGIPKERAFVKELLFISLILHFLYSNRERACVATGFRSVRAATDW